MEYNRPYNTRIDTFFWYELPIKWFMILVGWKGYTSSIFNSIYFIGVPTRKLMKHERMHESQIKKDGAIKYRVIWFLYFVLGLFKYRNIEKAYLNIPYEIEAVEAEDIK